jgi:hypothetical protein
MSMGRPRSRSGQFSDKRKSSALAVIQTQDLMVGLDSANSRLGSSGKLLLKKKLNLRQTKVGKILTELLTSVVSTP